MRLAALLLGLLAACSPAQAPPPLPPAPALNAPWLICDAIDAPVILVFERDSATARVAQYDKPNGALVQRTEYQIGAEEAAAGSVYTTLMQNGADVGAIRQTNPGMLETPGSAYTTPLTSVRLGEREISCRWLPRTRLMGITGRRTIVVSEDGDGDLLYHSYDFAAAAEAQPIEIAENGRTTTFSLEVRDGVEQMDANGARYEFQSSNTFQITIVAPRNGTARIDVFAQNRGGGLFQSEDLIAYIEGAGGE
jgi:hypothetical protein